MIENSDTVEIRWHGRGGQGAVTSAELVAQAAILEDKYAQAFPRFGPERRGAPVLAFIRINKDHPIRLRSEVTNPDIVVVLDPSLLTIVNITAGLKEGGIVVINTHKTVPAIREALGYKGALAVVDAGTIARQVLGVPITNTSMVGALVKAASVVKMESLVEPTTHRFGRLAERNINAMKRAYEETILEGAI